jgi:hypothetical protein
MLTGPATPSTPLIHKLKSKMPAAHSASPPNRTFTGFVTVRALLSKTLLDDTIPNFLRSIQQKNKKKQPYLLPQLQDLYRALRTGLLNSPHREPLWKGTSTTNLIATLADTARANTRQNPWRSSAAISLLTKAIQGFGAITTNYVLNAWKLQPYLWPSPPLLPAPTTTTHSGYPRTSSPPNSRNQLHHRHRTQAAATSLS